ncbi:hypothetical protein B0H11DRAFT_2193894 [Mycena galericulata]|nr:hypothetical protein B0H11DRAFT_2193894 [Mycena galericulata]
MRPLTPPAHVHQLRPCCGDTPRCTAASCMHPPALINKVLLYSPLHTLFSGQLTPISGSKTVDHYIKVCLNCRCCEAMKLWRLQPHFSLMPAPFLVPFPSLITPSSVYLCGPLNGYTHVFGCTGVGGTEVGMERVLAECRGDGVCVWVRAGGAGTGRAQKGGCEWTWMWRSGRTAGSETRIFSLLTRCMNRTCTTCGLLPPLSPSARFHGTHADTGVTAVQDGPPIDPLLYLPMRCPGPEFTCSSAQQTHHISQSSSFHSRH